MIFVEVEESVERDSLLILVNGIRSYRKLLISLIIYTYDTSELNLLLTSIIQMKHVVFMSEIALSNTGDMFAPSLQDYQY